MKTAELGNKVVIHYIGTLDNGRIFDTRDDDSPLLITLGQREIFPALENEIIGMTTGQVKNITIAAQDAYGPRQDENIIKLDRSAFPAGQNLQIGRKISMEFKDGSRRIMRVVAINEEVVTVDGNHALAGQDLTFALKLDAILTT